MNKIKSKVKIKKLKLNKKINNIVWLIGAMACLLPLNLSAQNSGWGIGIIIGSPTGLTAKYLFNDHSAFAINAGWSFYPAVGIHLTGDYQFLFPGVIKSEEGEAIKDLAPYLGIGGRFRVKEKEETDETDFHVGLRIGGGIEYRIRRFGIFLEIYPVVDLIPGTGFDVEGGLGFRFYF